MSPSPDAVKEKVRAGITAIAWVASEYSKINPAWIDADDYIQTMIIFESLVSNNGFNHQDLVARFRGERPTKVCGVDVKANGVEHVGQLHRLRQDPNPSYMATTGVTSGCAMKAMPLGVWFQDPVKMACLADNVTRVTHGTVEARLIGLLTAIRYRHALLDIKSPDLLITEWTQAAQNLGLHGSDAWNICNTAARRARAILVTSSGTPALKDLLRRVGMMYFAWSGPMSAIFWSYTVDPAFKKIFMHVGSDKVFTVDGEKILLDGDVFSEYFGHLKRNHSDWRGWINDPQKTGRQDSDTFFSIAFSIASVKDPGFLDASEKEDAINGIHREDWNPIIDAVGRRWR